MRNEIQADIKYITRDVSEQEILATMPKGDYIAVFGTSHTYGKCIRGDEATMLDEDDMWAHALGNKLGLEVLNISKPGNYNVNIVRQMIDFHELPDEVKSRCKVMVAEVRAGDTAGIMCTDLIEQPEIPNKQLNKTITDSYAFLTLGESIYNWENSLNAQFTNPISEGRELEEYSRSLIDHVGHYDDMAVPDAVVSNVMKYIDNHMHASSVSITPLLRDYDNIRTMKIMSDMAKIPFMWYCWDSHEVLTLEEQFFCERVYEKTSTIFDARIPKFELGVTQEYDFRFGVDELDRQKCDCGHYGENVNEWVAEQVKERIIELGHSI